MEETKKTEVAKEPTTDKKKVVQESPAITDQVAVSKYEIVKVKPGIVAWKGREINLETLTEAQKEKLVGEKFPYLKEKE